MDVIKRRDFTTQYTVLAAIISIVLFIAAFFISSISAEISSNTLSGDVIAFTHNPLFWIMLLLVLLTPIAAYLISWRLTGIIMSVQINMDSEKDRMHQISAFTEDLIKEDFTTELSAVDDNDKLGKALIKLRDTLKSNKENEVSRREEEGQRNWLAEGLAHFGEVLRNHANDLDKLSFAVIKDLTKYINAIQGGFYLLEDSDQNNRFFNLSAFFAFDRRKFADQQIKWGDGLIGTCALEKKTIHMNKVPDGYIRVTSGLGQTNPSSVLLEPLLYENKVYGVLEFATMKPFEKQHINLIIRVAGMIGSTLATVRNNLRTARLLEDSKAQAMMLSSQEEEMRQNMEELKATQEDAARQTQQYMFLEENINQALIRAELNTDGLLLQVNNLFLEKFGFKSFDEVEGKDIYNLIGQNELEKFNKIWHTIADEERTFSGKIKFTSKTGKELWTYSICRCIKQGGEKTDKIILLAADISEEQQQDKKLEVVLHAIDRTGFILEMDLHGTIIYSNNKFLDFIGISSADFNSVTLFDLVDAIESEKFIKRWDAIIKGIDYDGMVKLNSRKGEEKWINGSFTGIKDLHNQMNHIVFSGVDATDERFMEIQYKNLAENLRKKEKMIRESEKQTLTKIREVKTEMTNKFKEIEQNNARNEALLENATDAIIITGSDNRIILFNKSAEKLWGFDRTNVLNHNIGILFPDALIEQDEFLSRYAGPGDNKITGTRKMVKILDNNGIEKQVLFLISKAKINQENVYIAFVQTPEQ